jgi:ABC-type transport system involved in multi-copper enzyme maturation permease subunit
LLLPGFAVAMGLALAPVWIIPSRITYCCEGGLAYVATPADSMAHLAFGIGALIIALSAFGREFSFGTFPILFAQPVSRRRIWGTKTALVAAALLATTVAFTLSVHTHDVVVSFTRFGALAEYLTSLSSWWNIAGVALLFALMAFAGGQWTTLRFRQIGAAIFLTILTPLAIAYLTLKVWGYDGAEAPPVSMALPLLCYSVAATLWARRRFIEQRLSTSVELPGSRRMWASSWLAVSRSGTPQWPRLLRELQLQRIPLFVACGLLVFHLATLVLRGLSPDVQPIWLLSAPPWLWLLLSCVIGCTAIAEERSQGTIEGQLCLPGSRWRQFALKLGIVLVLGVLLGGLAPWGIESLAASLHIPNLLFGGPDDIGLAEWHQVDLVAGYRFAPLSWAALALAATLFAFFCSSLSRHTINALVALVALVLGARTAWTLFDRLSFSFVHQLPSEFCSDCLPARIFDLWRGPLVFWIGAPVLLTVLLGLSFSNYRASEIGRRLWVRSLAVLAVALLFTETATAFVYVRPWERLMTLEPPVGPARLSGPAQPRICSGNPWDKNLAVLLPDGRIWKAELFGLETVMLSPLGWSARVPVPQKGQFLTRAGWTDIACSGSVAMAIHSDGSLWLNDTKSQNQGLAELARLGSDSDWKGFINSGGLLLAHKTNGTIWAWGQEMPKAEQKWGSPPHRWNEPRRIGKEDSHLFSGEHIDNAARWTFGGLTRTQDGAIHATNHPVPFLSLSSPLSHRHDWIAAATPTEKAVYLYNRNPEAHIEEATFIALAADGTLSAWIDPPRNFARVRITPDPFGEWRPFEFVREESDIRGLLAPSRRPVWRLNVLGD